MLRLRPFARRAGFALVGLAMLAGLSAPGSRAAGSRASKSPAQLASVRYIQNGLTVQPPGKSKRPGKVKMPLFSRYFLATGVGQLASIEFFDGTMLHLNQQTDAVLKGSGKINLKHGELDEIDRHGTNHTVSTHAAVAAALGTNFDVKILPGRKTEVIVIKGRVLVKNAKGAVIVHANQEVVVRRNHKPPHPKPVDASSQISWTSGLPVPVVDELDAAVRQLLQHLNHDRSLHSLHPLTLDSKESACSLAHTIQMIQAGALTHEGYPADICVPHSVTGENIGQWISAPVLAVGSMNQEEYGEGVCPQRGCPGTEFATHGHFMNIVNPAYTSVGIGLAYVNGATWVTLDFVAP